MRDGRSGHTFLAGARAFTCRHSALWSAGDVILTGTPSGAGACLDPPRYLRAGDIVAVEVARVGVFRNRVIDDETKG